VRLDSHVSVHAARTGKLVARRVFRGATPGDCAENMQYIAARGQITTELTDWLEGLVGQGAEVPARP
jgi:hypothetical protein